MANCAYRILERRHKDTIIKFDQINWLLICRNFMNDLLVLVFVILIEVGIVIDDISERKRLFDAFVAGKHYTHNKLINISVLQHIYVISIDSLHSLENFFYQKIFNPQVCSQLIYLKRCLNQQFSKHSITKFSSGRINLFIFLSVSNATNHVEILLISPQFMSQIGSFQINKMHFEGGRH